MADIAGPSDLDQRFPTLEGGDSNLGRENFANRREDGASGNCRFDLTPPVLQIFAANRLTCGVVSRAKGFVAQDFGSSFSSALFLSSALRSREGESSSCACVTSCRIVAGCFVGFVRRVRFGRPYVGSSPMARIISPNIRANSFGVGDLSPKRLHQTLKKASIQIARAAALLRSRPPPAE